MDWLCDFYDWFWFNTQFWWSKTLRRPYTFVFHDFSHSYPIIYWSINVVVVGLGMWFISPWILLYVFVWYVNGHVTWGGHTEGDQEFPEYLGD
jgi:hypothetical protein